MTTYNPMYRMTAYAPRSVDPNEKTALTPVSGAAHSQPFRVATKAFGQAVRIGATTTRYMILNPVGTWPTTAFSVEFWGRLDSGINPAQSNWAFSYASTVQTNHILFGMETLGGVLRFRIFVNNSAVTDDATFTNDNKYHHFLATWQSSDGTTKLYQDGVLVETGTVQSGHSITGGGALVLGQDQDSIGGGFDATQAWKGELDEVRVYSRVLSEAEVLEHFAGVYRNETGLVGAWGFDLPGKIGQDSSPLNQNLVPTGFSQGTTDTILYHQPYLESPSEGRRGRIDPRGKGNDVGVMNFGLLDPQLAGTDPLARWLPAFLGNIKGQLRAGGLLCRVWESLDNGLTWRAFWAGRLRSLEQEDPVHYQLGIRDLSDDLKSLAFVGRPHPDVFYAAFPSILPVAGIGFPAAERAIVSSSVANPSTITMVKDHGYVTNDRIFIGGHAGSTPSINGEHTITVTGAKTFTIPVNVTVGGTGGHASKVVLSSTLVYGKLRVVEPLRGTIGAYTPYPEGRIITLDNKSRARKADNFFTQNLLEAAPLADENLFARVQDGKVPGIARARVQNVSTGQVGYFFATFSLDAPWALYGEKGLARVGGIGIVRLDSGDPYFLDFPSNGTVVDVWIETDHFASDETPLLIGDVHPVTLWRHLLEGKFGYRWLPDEPKPAGVNYGDPRLPIAIDAAAFAALEADTRFPPLRFVVTERTERGEWIRDNILRACNLTFYLNGDGAVVPIDLRTPTDVSSVPTITDADMAADFNRDWNYERDRAITRIDAVYYEDVIHKTSLDGGTTIGSLTFPKISGGALGEVKHPVTILDVGNSDLGDKPFAMNLHGFRTMAGEPGLAGQDRGYYLSRRLIDLAFDMSRPFGFGAPYIRISCTRGGNGDAHPGDLRKISVKTFPDPATNKLGGTRLLRVLERKEKKTFVELLVMDLGLPTVAATPTLGQPATEGGNTRDGATTAVTLNAAGDPVEVQYAITDTSVGSAPAVGDRLWTPVQNGLVRTTSTLTFRGLPTGKRVWVRGRSFPDPRVKYELPSAWVAASGTGRVDLGTMTAPSSPAASLQKARSFLITWTNGEVDLETELLIATPTTDPRVVVARVPAGSTRYLFPGTTGLLLQPSTTYRVGIRHIDGVEGVSAEVTVDVTTTSTLDTLKKPFRRPIPWR